MISVDAHTRVASEPDGENGIAVEENREGVEGAGVDWDDDEVEAARARAAAADVGSVKMAAPLT